MSDRTHYVYEALDADGVSLYVGCTGDPRTRYRAHMAGNGYGSGWFQSFVSRWRVSGPYPKAVAQRIEKELIIDRQPVWNTASHGNKKAPRVNGQLALVQQYLDAHEVMYVRRAGRNQPEVVPAPHLRSIKGGAA